MKIQNFAVAFALSLSAALPTQAIAAGPDLVAYLDLSTMQVITKNQGNRTAEPSVTTVTCQRYGSDNGCWIIPVLVSCGPGLHPLNPTQLNLPVPRLRPGQSHVVDIRACIKTPTILTNDECAVYDVWADAFYQVAETNEGNNMRSTIAFCRRPPPSNIQIKRN